MTRFLTPWPWLHAGPPHGDQAISGGPGGEGVPADAGPGRCGTHPHPRCSQNSHTSAAEQPAPTLGRCPVDKPQAVPVTLSRASLSPWQHCRCRTSLLTLTFEPLGGKASHLGPACWQSMVLLCSQQAMCFCWSLRSMWRWSSRRWRACTASARRALCASCASSATRQLR